MSEQNTANREKLLIPHTCGSKSFARKENEMEIEGGGIPVSRAALYDATHKRKDGSYITEEARINSEKMAAIQLQGLASQFIGPQDAFEQVMGPEHSGRVRGLRLGAVPSRVFGSFTHGASSSTYSSGSTSHLDKIAELQAQLKSESKKVKILQSCMHHIFKELPNVTPPPESAALLNPEENLDDMRPSSSSSYAPPPSRFARL